jgi:hypothetical protein
LIICTLSSHLWNFFFTRCARPFRVTSVRYAAEGTHHAARTSQTSFTHLASITLAVDGYHSRQCVAASLAEIIQRSILYERVDDSTNP